MLIYKNRITLQLFFVYLFLNATPVFGQAQQAYERGMEELNNGNTTQALHIWYDSYENSDLVDSRIGVEFIRVVSANSMRSYYEPATRLYYRAMTEGDGMESRVAVRQEIERLKPIIGDGIFRQWMNWWNEEDGSLGSDMKGFWVQHDPTPANITNERLIEHWQRIAEAKERFNKNEKTVYETDERALIYIRYGEPARSKNGILTLQSFNIQNWLENQLAPDRSNETRPPENIEDADREALQRLQNAIYEFHRYPEYEIWFYDQVVEPQNEPIIFLFGTDVRNDEFALQTSLEDFIPERAFYVDEEDEESLNFTRAGITPALILQLLYYEQLAQADDFFAQRLNELQKRILDQGIEAFQGMDLAFQTESQQIINQQMNKAPIETSTYADLIPQIPLNVYQYRFLSDSLEPEILTYIESSAQEAFLIDYNRNEGRNLLLQENTEKPHNILEEKTYYELNHNLLAYNNSWEVSVNRTDHPSLVLTRPTQDQVSTSAFWQSHTGRTFQSVSVELMNYNPNSESLFETPFPPALRGWNKQLYRQPEPLGSHPDTLEVSDLVLGFNHPSQKTAPFDFRVANNKRIPFGETLLLHFEVYNLMEQADGFTHFEMTYRILPVDEQGNILRDQSEFVLTLNYTNETNTVKEDLEIETANLDPGFYELAVSIFDTQANQIRDRSIRFEVVE